MASIIESFLAFDLANKSNYPTLLNKNCSVFHTILNSLAVIAFFACSGFVFYIRYFNFIKLTYQLYR